MATGSTGHGDDAQEADVLPFRPSRQEVDPHRAVCGLRFVAPEEPPTVTDAVATALLRLIHRVAELPGAATVQAISGRPAALREQTERSAA
jgi:hypothetical protein